jgi:hypothetical protein
LAFPAKLTVRFTTRYNELVAAPPIQDTSMKPVILILLLAAAAGAGLGTALGYIEARLPEQPARSTGATEAEDDRPKRGPVAQVPEKEFNFDRIEQGASMKHAFKIRNVGDAPLKVSVLKTTCKCTVGDLAKNEIAPGEETEVELEWTAKTSPGPFRHGATLSTSDPGLSTLELTVEGDVVASSTLQPAELLLGTVSASTSRSVSTILTSNLTDDAQILKHEFSDPEIGKQFKLEITPLEKSELPRPEALSGVKLTATYDAGKSIGPFFTWLTLHTNLKNAQKLTVPVTGSVVGDISVFSPLWTPSQGVLRIGPVPRKTGKSVRLNLAIRGEHAVGTKLDVASVDPPELKVTLGEPKQMSDSLVHVPMTVEIPAGTRQMVRISKITGDEESTDKGDGEIVLSTTHPDTTEVRLKVRFSVE